MAEFPKQNSDYVDGLGQMINGFRGNSTISVSDQMMMTNGLNAKSDAFIVDLESFSNGGLDKDVASNSRINMQRSYSKKGYLQGGDQESSLVSSSSSPRGGQGSTPEKLGAVYSQAGVVVEVGATHPSINQTAGSFIASKTRWDRRQQYNSFKRSPPPQYWFSFSDPKRVLLFFATLSSLGTILLIYFTLSMRSTYEYDTNPEWQP